MTPDQRRDKVIRIACVLKLSFQNRIAQSAGKSFKDTGVSTPRDEVWEQYAEDVVAAEEIIYD